MHREISLLFHADRSLSHADRSLSPAAQNFRDLLLRWREGVVER